MTDRDYSSSAARIPEAPPRDLNLDETIVPDDRDDATPVNVAGAHLNALRSEVAALYENLIADTWGFVEDAGGLNVCVHAGRAYTFDGVVHEWAKNAAYALTDDATNYIEITAAGAISHNTSSFTAGRIPLAQVTTVGGDITAVADKRGFYLVPSAGDIDHGGLVGLGDDDHTGYLLADGSRGLSGDWDAGEHEIAAATIQAGTLSLDSPAELTISSGAVTVTQTLHCIDTEGSAGTDNLDTINGGSDGQFAVLRAKHADRTVVVKDGTGNLELAGSDIPLDDTDQYIMLVYDDALSKWLLAANPPGSALGNHTLDAPEHTDVAALTEAQGQILFYGTAWDALDPGTAGRALLTQGAGADPVWGKVILADGSQAFEANFDAGPHQIRAATFRSDVATGTPPLVIASETVVANLNADLLDGYDAVDFLISPITDGDVDSEGATDGYVLTSDGADGATWEAAAGAGDLKADGTVPLTANWDVGAFKVTALQLESDIATGTAPLLVASETVVSQLNADKVDGEDASDLLAVDGSRAMTGNLNLDGNNIDNVGALNIVNAALNITREDNVGHALFHRYYTGAASGGVFAGFKARGTKGSPIVVSDGDSLIQFLGRGYDGSAFQFGVKFAAEVDGTPGSGDMPSRWVWKTTPDGSITPAEHLRVDSGGYVHIGAPASGTTPAFNGCVAMWLNEAAHQLMFQVKYSDGTSKIGSISLS